MKQPDPEALEWTRRLLAKARVIPHNPSEAAIVIRVIELGRLGLADEPEFVGLSSSIRQYAINSLASEMARAAGEVAPTAMVTNHAGLLERADVLAARYGLRPVPVSELLQALDR